MDFIKNLKSSSVLGNTYLDYSLAVITIVGGFLLIWIVKSIFIHRLKALAEKTKTEFDDHLIRLTDSYVVPSLYFVSVYLGLVSLKLPEGIDKAVHGLLGIVLLFLGVRFSIQLLKMFIFDYWITKKKERQDLETHLRALMPFITFIIWALGIVFLLDNLGFNISAIVTGLGIGGVAVAIAASAVFGDLFAYIAILFDKPFVLGEFIIVGDYLGSVEKIGIKTTRIRSLGGEEIVFSNKALTDSQIRNYKRMEKRRVVFKLGTTYGTTLEKIKDAPEVVKKVIESVPDTKFDRAHFSSFGDFSLNIEAVYYVLSNDYNKYMDIQQQINFKIKEEFEKKGIEFAFPTQTLHLVR